MEHDKVPASYPNGWEYEAAAFAGRHDHSPAYWYMLAPDPVNGVSAASRFPRKINWDERPKDYRVAAIAGDVL